MVGELPGDFLRLGTSSQQQQSMSDERVAQILQAQQQAGYTVMPANIRGKLSISVVQVCIDNKRPLMNLKSSPNLPEKICNVVREICS